MPPVSPPAGPRCRNECWLWLRVWRDDGAVKAVFALPVMPEAADPRGGSSLAGPYDTFVGVPPGGVTSRLFRMAIGAGVFSGGGGDDGDDAAPQTLLLVPQALAGGAPGAVFRSSEIWQWLKCCAVDPLLGANLERCPLSQRPYAGQIDVYRRLATRGEGTWVSLDDLGSELAYLRGEFRSRARWEASEFGFPDTTRAPPGSLLFRAVNEVVVECEARDERQRRASARARRPQGGV